MKLYLRRNLHIRRCNFTYRPLILYNVPSCLKINMLFPWSSVPRLVGRRDTRRARYLVTHKSSIQPSVIDWANQQIERHVTYSHATSQQLLLLNKVCGDEGFVGICVKNRWKFAQRDCHIFIKEDKICCIIICILLLHLYSWCFTCRTLINRYSAIFYLASK